MSDQITVALISATAGGLMVAIVKHLFTRKRTEAETDKLRAEAEKLREETRQLTLHTKQAGADHAMAEAIKESREIIQIMGISLHGLFSGGGSVEVTQELRKKSLLKKGPRIRVVLMDFDTIADAGFPHQEISRDIRETIRTIERDFPNIEVRLTKSVNSFMLATDYVVLIEPIKFGQSSRNRILIELRPEKQSQQETFRAHFESAWKEGRPYR